MLCPNWRRLDLWQWRGCCWQPQLTMLWWGWSIRLSEFMVGISVHSAFSCAIATKFTTWAMQDYSFSWHNLPGWGSAVYMNKGCGASLLPLQNSSDLARKLHLLKHVPKVPLTHLLGWHFSFSHSRSIQALSSCCYTFRQATCQR